MKINVKKLFIIIAAVLVVVIGAFAAKTIYDNTRPIVVPDAETAQAIAEETFGEQEYKWILDMGKYWELDVKLYEVSPDEVIADGPLRKIFVHKTTGLAASAYIGGDSTRWEITADPGFNKTSLQKYLRSSRYWNDWAKALAETYSE